MSVLPSSTVVISTRDRVDFLRDAVTSILAGTHLPDEIVIVDQGRDAARATAGLPSPGCEIRYVALDTKGAGRSRNAGIRAVRTEVIVILDDDVVVERHWLERLLSGLVAAGPRAVVTGRVLPGAPDTPAGRAVSVKTDEAPAVYEGRIGIEVLSGNNVAFRRSVVDEVGLYDERLGPGSRYGSADDNDFGFRLLEAGYRIHYLPDAALVHRAWRSGRDLRRLNWDYGRGQGAFYAKHIALRDLHMLGRLADLVRERAIWIARRPLRRRSVGGHGDVIYTAGVLSAFAQWMVQERLLSRLQVKP